MKIDHIQLAIPENSEPLCRRFWTEILGFEELEKPENLRGRGGAWFRPGSVEIHLGVEKNFRSAKKAHPAFAVAQITLLADSLKANDHAVRWIPQSLKGDGFSPLIQLAIVSNLLKFFTKREFSAPLAPRFKPKHRVVPMIYFLYPTFDIEVIDFIQPTQRRVV